MAPAVLNGQDRLIVRQSPRSPAAEAYRQLRTNIQFSSLDHPIRTLLVTSAGPDEGKSTTLANLAITMAQAGHRVILVDCDLRRPAIHALFDLPNQVGLTSLVLGEAMTELPLQESGVPNLSILPSGPLPPSPSEVLGSRRMGEAIARLRDEADYVLLDSPPVIAVADAAVLATRVDGVLLVVHAGLTRRDLARKAKAVLDKVNANLLGVVLNNVKYDASLHNYYAEQEKIKR